MLVAIEQLEQLFNPTIQMNSIGHQLNHILEGYRQKITAFPTQTGFILLLENPAQEEATYLAQTTHLAKNLLEQLMKLNPKLSFKLANNHYRNWGISSHISCLATKKAF